jgi:recombination protein RecA
MAAASEKVQKLEKVDKVDKADNTDKVERIVDKERAKAVEVAVGQIEKQFGKGSIMRLGGKGPIAAIPSISTGSISLDWALGVGGLPRGRVIEIFGPESSGKTTLALQTIAQAQLLGGVAAFVDAEHALDAQYAQKLGVDLENLLVSQPDNGEQALEIVEVLGINYNTSKMTDIKRMTNFYRCWNRYPCNDFNSFLPQ